MDAPTARTRNKWFLREPSPVAPARLFCLPYSGCGASMYRQWPSSVDGVEVCPVQPPGRENRMREPAHTTYEALADDLCEALRPYLDRPYALFGHCGSALAAYETAVRLVQRGCPAPTRLFVSSEVAPQDGPYGRFLGMSDDELAAELRGLVAELGGTLEPSLLALCLGVLRNDVDMNKRYHVAEPVRLPCPVTAIGWTEDTGIAPSLMAGWSACGETTSELLEGGHYRFIEAPAELLALLVADLTPTRSRTS
ncbi:thioesterase II family protein [Streptomyces sp. CBMA156]|uniref:thioesterase II family protein n=1 Tax=Streptomyces sp. CBMA156 TaxID=1930280 RepID=UPI001D45A39C|nr:thioesterase domain-containing protein [Streptomyces sp. CBMA156]MBD0675710.1 thioesterase [Streptomyces sp. CBMA156]